MKDVASQCTAHETPGKMGMSIAGDDAQAIEWASRLIRDIGFATRFATITSVRQAASLQSIRIR